MVNLRVNYVSTDVLSRGDANLRTNYVVTEPYTRGYPNLRVNYNFNEAFIRGYPLLRVNYVVVEVLCAVDPEEQVSTNPFPGFGNSQSNPAIPAGADPFNSALPGLTFSVHKKPAFNTRISTGSSGFEVRNAQQEFPYWDFELTYDFLEDRTGAESSLKTIMGFFLARQGSFDSFLFKDPDDYLCVGSTCATLDGATTVAYFCREMTGGFLERVGQVDTANTVTLYLTEENGYTIPATPGPYTIDVSSVAITDLGVVYTSSGTALTKVVGAPASGQYSVNESTGVYTFNSAQQNTGVTITYRYVIDPADYTITLPNIIIFDSAPPAGILTADFQFFFVCRFAEDQVDFEKFMDKLWSLQQCNFRSLIQ